MPIGMLTRKEQGDISWKLRLLCLMISA